MNTFFLENIPPIKKLYYGEWYLNFKIKNISCFIYIVTPSFILLT